MVLLIDYECMNITGPWSRDPRRSKGMLLESETPLVNLAA